MNQGNKTKQPRFTTFCTVAANRTQEEKVVSNYEKLDLGNSNIVNAARLSGEEPSSEQETVLTAGDKLLTVLAEIKIKNFVATQTENEFEKTTYKSNAGKNGMNAEMGSTTSITGTHTAILGTSIVANAQLEI